MDINFAAKTAIVTAKPDKAISRDTVETALKGAGYGVTDFTKTR